ncbi:MAG: S8 family serine peptidase, partial [Candidatus Thorarchaeota archaeon]
MIDPLKPPLSSNSNQENIIVFFNESSYDPLVKQRFQFYGGNLKENEDWNNVFNTFSGFAGSIPTENISLFKEEFPEINIEVDELTKTQMNYATVQTHAVNNSWAYNGFKGNTAASVAVLDTGINPFHEYLQDKVIGWENFIDENPISDDNGHGTFISSVIGGTGSLPYNSSVPASMCFQNNFTHLDLFEDFIPSKNYSLKLFTFNASQLSSFIVINSSFQFELIEIDTFWVELYHDSALVNSSKHQLSNQNKLLYQDITQSGIGIYDIYIIYHKKVNTNPSASYNIEVSYFPETYVQNFNHFNGIANATKILSYKVANESGDGFISDLISGLASIIQNKTNYQVISVCLSIATFGTDVTAINRVIDEVIDNHIFVVIAAGNSGPAGDRALNALASNKRAIVVGAVNDKDRISSYSSMGKEIVDGIIKPDLVAPGGSILKGYRSIISAGKLSDTATGSYGTSISAAIIAGVINLLIEVKWGSWVNWNSDNLDYWINYLKAILCMTASETRLNRENDPNTDLNEEVYSPSNFMGFSTSLKDEHEGYGRLNLESAIDALTKYLIINDSISGYLESSEENPLGAHVVARKVNLEKNTQYLFNLTNVNEDADFEVYLFSNSTTQEGEPILLQSSRKWYENPDFFYFTPKENETNCVLTIKALQGKSN